MSKKRYYTIRILVADNKNGQPIWMNVEDRLADRPMRALREFEKHQTHYFNAADTIVVCPCDKLMDYLLGPYVPSLFAFRNKTTGMFEFVNPHRKEQTVADKEHAQKVLSLTKMSEIGQINRS